MDYKPTVLIADDSETFVMYLAILLDKMSFHAVPAPNGSEAIELAKKISPDVIMLDIDMPDMNGKEVLKIIKNDPRISSIPVIMLTILGDDRTVAECKRLNCKRFVSKPVNPSQLHDVILQCMNNPDIKKRKLIRTSYKNKILLHHNGVSSEHSAVSLSQGGVFFRDDRPLPKGTKVSVTLDLHNDERLHVAGTVIYTKGIFGNVFNIGLGMAIEFTDLSETHAEKLRDYINDLLAEDVAAIGQ